MQIKKTTFIIASISAIFVGVNFMVAKAYEPLVRLPGLPTTGEINLSQYIVGLYNFLLSIVGIVAVMMLIIGGMKYITAAGNASIISDAKDTISNALFGLLLALLSWVIVSTINPDVLYIKNPGADFTKVFKDDLGACGYYDPDPTIIPPAPNCVCEDAAVAFISITSQEACHDICVNACGTTEASPCIAGGSSEKTIRGRCTCVDKMVVISLGPAGTSCNDICQTPALVTDGKNHCYVVDFRIGKANIDEAFYLPSDKDRARKFAIYDGNTWDNAIKIVEGCHTYVNAGDYTTKFSDLVHLQIDNGAAPGFDGDCWGTKVWPLDFLTQPNPGYFGPQIPLAGACTVDEIMVNYVAWLADANCKNGENGSVICPIRICAEYSDSAKITNTKYLELIKP